ncbi:MAG: AAA family ATPase [Bacteroidetes bacterium 4572_114]|nr:MAG: AAA family ATPase [Bacteroidetes bacterium 4572_114]
MLDQIFEYLKQNTEEVYQLTLEDTSILSKLNQHPENIFDFIIRVQGKRVFVLIDEIQYLDNPSNFLKLLFDKYSGEIKIIATGSSAFYIDRKFKDSLAGRKRLFDLYTLDLEEFLYFRTGSNDLVIELERIRTNEMYISTRRNELNNYFVEYLTYGGYPAVVLANGRDKKNDVLKELSGSFLKRDISESNIQDQNKFYQLLIVLAQQTGSLVNTNELSRLLSLSVTAVENYLYVLQKCFYISLMRPFYKNIRKELTKMPMVYFHDLGFRNILLNQFLPPDQRLDKGMLIENYAYTRLRNLYGNDQLRFWRTADGNEIDFIHVRSPEKGEAIEIKFNEKGYNPAKYRKFLEAYPEYTMSCRAFVAQDNKQSLLAL